MTAWRLWRLRVFPRTGAPRVDAERHEDEVTLQAFVAGVPQGPLRTRIVLLLTLAAGWIDTLCYLDLGTAAGRVFASFMTGNILFVGISLAQGNMALLLRAGLAILVFLASATLGSLYLGRLPGRQPLRGWHKTLARYLLGEGLVLLVFGLLWQLTGNPAQHPAIQVVLIGIAAFGMGLQGALVGAFNLPNVVSIALTGTELLLGMRLAEGVGRQAADRREGGGTSAPFLVALLLSYALAALAVVLTTPWISTQFIPLLFALVAVLVVLATPGGETRGGRS